MRLLVAGDFHKIIPKYLNKLVREHKPDAIISPGDFCIGAWFDEPKNIKKAFAKGAKKGKETLKYLNSLGLPVYIVFGNHDFYGDPKGDIRSKYGKFESFVKKLKNVSFIHKRKIKLEDYTLIGYSGYRSFALKLDLFEKVSKLEKKTIMRYRKMFKNHLTHLLKGRKKVILLTHEPPYDTKLDKIRNKKSPLDGFHIGDDTFRWAIKKFKPLVHICGHMHENLGKIKLGKTTVVNSGFGQGKQAAIIDLKGDKVKVKLIR